MARFPEAPMPERPRGTPEEQIRSLYRSIGQIAEALNNIISAMNKEEKKDDQYSV